MEPDRRQGSGGCLFEDDRASKAHIGICGGRVGPVTVLSVATAGKTCNSPPAIEKECPDRRSPNGTSVLCASRHSQRASISPRDGAKIPNQFDGGVNHPQNQ